MTEINDYSIRYRPKTLDEVVGNSITVNQIRKFIETNTFPKASLFIGMYGSGKTTFVYILKDLLECSDMNFVEINGGKTSGKETIQEIIGDINLLPIGKSKTRIIFIDEAHKLSDAAISSLLKDTEAPNCKHVYFMFASNIPEKINPALKSRTTQFRSEPLDYKTIAKDLLFPICKKENLNVSKDVLIKIGKLSNGSCREALVWLNAVKFVPEEEQLAYLEKYTCDSTEHKNVCSMILYGKYTYEQVLTELSTLESDPESFRWQLMYNAGKVLLDPTKSLELKRRASDIVYCFGNNFNDTKEAGLGYSLFEFYNKGK